MIATNFDLRRLQKNDRRLTSLCLNLTCKGHPKLLEHIKELSSALANNTVVNQVSISADDSFNASSCSKTMKALEGLTGAIGDLPLRSLLLSGSPVASGVGVVPVRLASLLLQSTSRLETLIVYDVSFTGTQADFDLFAQAVQGLWFLQRFSLDNFRVNSTTTSLDALLLSLSTLPSLQALSVSSSDSDCFSTTAFSALFFSSSIKVLKLKHLALSDDSLISMAELLQGNTALQSLTMGPLPDLSPTVAKSMADIIDSSSPYQKFPTLCP